MRIHLLNVGFFSLITWFPNVVCIQTRLMEEKFEFERDDLRGRLVVLEKKLAERTQDLSLAESTLANRDIEFESLQSSLVELNELREMKEVGNHFVP